MTWTAFPADHRRARRRGLVRRGWLNPAVVRSGL